MQQLAWRTSSYSGSGGNCVEVAPAGSSVLLRDTKNRLGPVICFSAAQWRIFLAEVVADAPSANGVATAEASDTGIVLRGAAGAALRFTRSEWSAFHSGVHSGEFDALVD
jgi:hypothetical protein